jgi:predicted nucleotidyltransferase
MIQNIIDIDIHPQNVLFKAVCGSHLYGLNHKDSDVDIRGIFIQSQFDLLNLNTPIQIADDKQDIVYYDIKRFVELAASNNPNILELLAVENPIHRSPLMEYFPLEMFLSKKCKESFCGYAISQIKKSMGLNKKMVNPQPEKRKDILSFSYILDGYNSVPFWKYFERKFNITDKELILEKLRNFGLTRVQNGEGIYTLYEGENLRGLVQSLEATDFRLSSIPTSVAASGTPLLMYYNHNGFQAHCKSHREYWEWVQKRNESRYDKNKEVGKSYDTKNMMHTFRLLNVGLEIAQEAKINNDRTQIDKDFLLSIRDRKSVV